jgi:hypothetical protein
MSTLEKAAQQALEALENTGDLWWNSKDEAVTALRAALAQQEQEADYPEEKLQSVAEHISDKYHVWYGVNARDIEEVLRQSVSCGLVNNPPRRETEQEPLSVEALARALVASRVIDAAALDDPDGYDGGLMLDRVRAAYRRLV